MTRGVYNTIQYNTFRMLSYSAETVLYCRDGGGGVGWGDALIRMVDCEIVTS